MPRILLSDYITKIDIKSDSLWVEKVVKYGLISEIIFEANQMSRIDALNNRCYTIISKILKENRIENKDAFLKICRYLAQNITKISKNRAIARICKINVHTVERYIKILIENNIIFKLEGYHKSLKNEIHKNSKFYFTDNSFLYYFSENYSTHFTVDIVKVAENKLNLKLFWKNLIINEMRKSIDHKSISNIRLMYFWQNWSGGSIDLVIWDKFHRKTSCYNFDYDQSISNLNTNNAIGFGELNTIDNLKIWQKNYPKSKLFEVTPRNVISFVKL